MKTFRTSTHLFLSLGRNFGVKEKWVSSVAHTSYNLLWPHMRNKSEECLSSLLFKPDLMTFNSGCRINPDPFCLPLPVGTSPSPTDTETRCPKKAMLKTFAVGSYSDGEEEFMLCKVFPVCHCFASMFDVAVVWQTTDEINLHSRSIALTGMRWQRRQGCNSYALSVWPHMKLLLYERGTFI